MCFRVVYDIGGGMDGPRYSLLPPRLRATLTSSKAKSDGTAFSLQWELRPCPFSSIDVLIVGSRMK